MLTLIEKAQAQFDEEQSMKMAEKMAENRFDYSDFVEQLDQVTNMGPMEDIMKMIPGMSQMELKMLRLIRKTLHVNVLLCYL